MIKIDINLRAGHSGKLEGQIQRQIWWLDRAANLRARHSGARQAEQFFNNMRYSIIIISIIIIIITITCIIILLLLLFLKCYDFFICSILNNFHSNSVMVEFNMPLCPTLKFAAMCLAPQVCCYVRPSSLPLCLALKFAAVVGPQVCHCVRPSSLPLCPALEFAA